MRKLALSLLCLVGALSLQGCVAGALVAGGAMGTAAVVEDPRTLHIRADDERIVRQSYQQLANNPGIAHDSHVEVASYNHVVLLVGQTPTTELRDQAVQIVKQIPNVTRIFNEITIETPTSPGQRSRDVAITANVKTRLLATTNVKSGDIKVVTENGVVYLMGMMNRDQANIVAEVVRNSSGVKRVVKLIQYS